MAKKFNYEDMQQSIKNNWNQFQEKMKHEWNEFNEEELAEAKQNLHSFVVQVEHRTKESKDYVQSKLADWRQQISGKGPAEAADSPRK